MAAIEGVDGPHRLTQGERKVAVVFYPEWPRPFLLNEIDKDRSALDRRDHLDQFRGAIFIPWVI